SHALERVGRNVPVVQGLATDAEGLLAGLPRARAVAVEGDREVVDPDPSHRCSPGWTLPSTNPLLPVRRTTAAQIDRDRGVARADLTAAGRRDLPGTRSGASPPRPDLHARSVDSPRPRGASSRRPAAPRRGSAAPRRRPRRTRAGRPPRSSGDTPR